MPRRAPTAPLLALAALACTWGGPDAPAIVAVAPTEAPNHVDTQLTVTGRSFEPVVTVDFDSPDGSTVDAGFAISLVSATDRIALGQVTRTSSTELQASVEAGTQPGTWDVEIRDPRGRVATLPAAFVLYAPMPPIVRLVVSPGGGTAGTTTFTLDASGSADARHPLATLEFRFDSNGDGNWSSWSASATHTATYDNPGVYTAAVQVRDAQGLTAWGTTLVVVAAAGTEVQVTTAADEKDAGATPADPKGTGLSLREAVTWVNAQGTARTITLHAPLTITMIPPSTYMTLTAPGAAIVGEPGVVLDFGGINQSCLTLGAANQLLVGLELRGCVGTFVTMASASGGSQVAQVTTTVTGQRYWAYGIQAQSTSATTSRIGPGNDLSGLWFGLKVDGTAYEILGNRLYDNAVGARLAGNSARLRQNTFVAQVAGASNRGNAVELLVGPGPIEVLNNAFDGNAGSGIEAAAVASLTVRNNLFTRNGALGLNASSSTTHDHNGYFRNAGGDVGAALTLGATDLLADPLYADVAGGDLRLLPTSPAIDAGLDTGLDVNGAAPGLFSGSAPDLGAFESP